MRKTRRAGGQHSNSTRAGATGFLATPRARGSVLVVLLAVVVEADCLVVNDCLDVDGAAPAGVDVFEDAAGVVEVEFGAFVLVCEVEFAVAVVVAVGDDDEGEAEVGHV